MCCHYGQIGHMAKDFFKKKGPPNGAGVELE